MTIARRHEPSARVLAARNERIRAQRETIAKIRGTNPPKRNEAAESEVERAAAFRALAER